MSIILASEFQIDCAVKTFIYYDLEEVLPEDVRKARSRAPGATEFIARGTRWPEEFEGNPPAELCNPREIEYQQSLMAWTRDLFTEMERSSARSVLIRENGISLLEILRYRFVFDFAAVEQRWRVAGDMCRKGAERILWVSPSAENAKIKDLTSKVVLPRIEAVPVERSVVAPNRLWRMVRSFGRAAVDRLVNVAETMTNRSVSASESGSPFAVVEYYANSAKTLIPVVAALRDQHGIETVWIAARRQVKQMLARHGISSVLLRRLTPNSNRAGMHFGLQARRKLLEALESAPNTIYCGTGSLAGKSFLLPEIVETLSNLLEESTYWLDSLLEAFGTLRPRCVVSTTYSSAVGRAAALAARARNARSIFVQHGMFPDHDLYTDFCNDTLLVWGNANRQTIMRNGIAEPRIKVVGAAIYDDLIRRSRLHGLSRFPSPGEMLRVAFMASRTGGLVVGESIARLHLTAVIEAVSRIPTGQLTVKLHPADNSRMVESVLKGFPNVSSVREGSSQDVILQSDVVIVSSSTTGLEACIAGKPLIVLHTKGISETDPYRKYGAALHVSVDHEGASENLARTLQSLVASPTPTLDELAAGRKRIIEDLLNGGNGDAVDLTARAVADVSNGRVDTNWSAGAAN